MLKNLDDNLRVMKIFVIALLILVTIFFLLAPGTDDVLFWKNWASNANTYGLASGFSKNNDMYPPLSTLILAVSAKMAKLVNFDFGGAVRLAVLGFTLLTSIVFWLWTKDFYLTILLHLSLLLGSVAFKSIDIFFAPFLLISFWGLKEKRMILFSIFYTLAFLVKWQPLIIAPMIALYILDIQSFSEFKKVNFKHIVLKVLLPAILVLFLVWSVFGFGEVYLAFKKALNNVYLSGNALNFNWIVTHFLHVMVPGVFGGLIDGQATYIINAPTLYSLPSRIIFYLVYLVTLFAFIKVEKSYQNLVLFSLVGYLAYFTFNTGVHESHLFLPTLMTVILFWLNKRHVFIMIIIMIMYHVNLLLFYGIDGRGLTFNRAINGRIDIALLFGIFNVGFFIFIWSETVFRKRTA